MKKLVLSLVAVVLVAFLAACGGGGSSTNKGRVGESCTHRDDCQDTLRCVKAVCVASEEDGDTNEVATDGDKNEKDTDTDQVATDGDMDTEMEISWKIINKDISSANNYCKGARLIVTKRRPGGVAGCGGVAVDCCSGNTPQTGVCNDFVEFGVNDSPKSHGTWWHDKWDKKSDSEILELADAPAGEYMVLLLYMVNDLDWTGDGRTSCVPEAPIKIESVSGEECFSFEYAADLASTVALYSAAQPDDSAVYYSPMVWRDIAIITVTGGQPSCSNVKSLLSRELFSYGAWATSNSWEEWISDRTDDRYTLNECIALNKSLTQPSFLNPRAVDDPGAWPLGFQENRDQSRHSASPASAWCYPHNDPDCVAVEAAAQAASYPDKLEVDGDYESCLDLWADCLAHPDSSDLPYPPGLCNADGDYDYVW